MTPEEWRTHAERLIEALDSPNAADWLASIATVLAAVVAVIALIVAILAGRGQINEAREARALTAKLDRDRSQPSVVMFMEPSVASMALLDIVIKNFGLTPARDVRVQIEPWPEMARGEGSSTRTKIPIPEVIPMLAPGQEWRAMWDNGIVRKKTDLPEVHKGTVSYSGIDGEELSTPSTMDWSIYMKRRVVTLYTVHDAAKGLKGIADSIKKVSHNGLDVMARNGDNRDVLQEVDFYDREMLEHRRDPENWPAPDPVAGWIRARASQIRGKKRRR
ncbi:hypothetical protein HQQ82_02650 [Rathayibacter sp. VKM Ac-2856]|uniref:hypothetical protein n=1 Tax=unclassified Rathayibacter TaxID=2609250 RepID=UPI00156551C4|nr:MULTISPECIES: hypothetical protein [unclassified Rathayibacter]NQX03693.1 hypothetical protein [Rathayibacter sp. VKM Ac-2858]NQX18861.1 hypothetical protein [Rathayibacter sp. VKM Ac-2856]